MRILLRQVSCGYPGKKPVLDHINMELNTGEICCILGPNGVGKTTLFKTILGILPLKSGLITIDGEDISRWNAKKRARTMAYVAQSHVPAFPYTVEEIAMIGRAGLVGRFSSPTRHDQEVVERVLSEMGLLEMRSLPYTEISGGERQLLMIARALAQEPDLLILDEPTANLDFGNMARVLTKLKKLSNDGLSIIFTSHLPDQAFLLNAKTALLMENEPMVFGDYEKVITEYNLMRAYHAPVQTLEWIDKDGQLIRKVAPKLTE